MALLCRARLGAAAMTPARRPAAVSTAVPLLVRRAPYRQQRMGTVCFFTHYAADLLPGVTEEPGNIKLGSYEEPDDSQGHHGLRPLSYNKSKLAEAFETWGSSGGSGGTDVDNIHRHHWPVSEDHKHLMMAMAMQETTHIEVSQRDVVKDRDGLAANATVFNLSLDLVKKTGYYPNDVANSSDEWAALNADTQQQLVDGVGILETAFTKWGIENTLAFVRAGGSAFDPYKGKYWQECVDDMCDEHGAPFTPQTKLGVKRDVWKYLSCIKRYLHFIDDDDKLMTDRHRPNIDCPHIDYQRPA